MSVREGHQSDVRNLLNDMVAATQNEAGTSLYEWFLSGDGATCHINERYDDSAAALVHLGNFGAKFSTAFLHASSQLRF